MTQKPDRHFVVRPSKDDSAPPAWHRPTKAPILLWCSHAATCSKSTFSLSVLGLEWSLPCQISTHISPFSPTLGWPVRLPSVNSTGPAQCCHYCYSYAILRLLYITSTVNTTPASPPMEPTDWKPPLVTLTEWQNTGTDDGKFASGAMRDQGLVFVRFNLSHHKAPIFLAWRFITPGPGTAFSVPAAMMLLLY